MRSRDLVMIVVSFLAMLAGSFLPGLAEPLAPFPRLCLIVLPYLGFLSVGTEALFTHTRLIPGTVSGLVLYAHGLKAGIAPPHGWAWIRAWGALPVAEYGGLRITAPTRAWAHSHAIG